MSPRPCHHITTWINESLMVHIWWSMTSCLVVPMLFAISETHLINLCSVAYRRYMCHWVSLNVTFFFKDNTKWSHWVIWNGYPNLNTNHERWNKYVSSVADRAILWYFGYLFTEDKNNFGIGDGLVPDQHQVITFAEGSWKCLRYWFELCLGVWSTPSHHLNQL